MNPSELVFSLSCFICQSVSTRVYNRTGAVCDQSRRTRRASTAGGLCQQELFDVFWHHEQVKQWKCQCLVFQIKAITTTADIFTCAGIQQKLDFHQTGLLCVISVHP